MEQATEETWAQLVSITENISDPIEINRSKFIIGRSKVADLSLFGNKLVSGNHCFIQRDEEGRAWLHDTSTNGTLLNLTKKVLGNRVALQHGDEVYVVYRKADPSLNVAYMYQDLEVLRREAIDMSSEPTLEYTLDDFDQTAENSDSLEPGSSGVKRKTPDLEVSRDDSVTKKQKTDEIDSSKNTNENKNDIVSEKADSGEPEKDEPDSGNTDETKVGSDEKKTEPAETDDFEDSLICIICQEILHDCISCQPCMHSFCAGCYSDWMSRSTECPSCRGTVERVNKNYIINNLVDAYLKNHPEKKRPEDEIKALDARSKIMKNSMKPLPPKKTLSDYIDDDDDQDDDDEELSASEEDDADTSPGGLTGFGITNPFGGVSFLKTFQYKPPKTVCRQCPEYKDPLGNILPPGTTALTSTEVSNTPDTGDPSTSTGSDAPGAGGHSCTPNQVHILCQCCLQPMPDRRHGTQTVPAQQCVLCYRMYCHAYWGCKGIGCNGCLAKFKDLDFGRKLNMMPDLILQNVYESDILKNYLAEKGHDVEYLVKMCLDKLNEGTFTCIDKHRGLSTDSVICCSCGLRNLRDLVYLYRKSIPNEDLPESVTQRPDCYWGKNCRTQRGKMHHALKFNHICDQTRTG